MDITIFLALVLGWYFVIVGFFIIFRQHQLIEGFASVIQSPGMMMFTAIVTMIVGLLMVISHNIWSLDWPLVITVIAWFTLINGMYRLFFPDRAASMVKKCMDKPLHFRFIGLISLVLGIFLLYMVKFVIGM